MLDIFRTLPGLMHELEGSEVMREALVFAAWRRIAGEGLCEHTAPVKLENATLTVAVRNLMWQRQLKDLGGQLLFKLNAALGTPTVSYIQVEIDEAAAASEQSTRRKNEGLDDAAAEQEITAELRAAATRIEDEELRRQFLAAAAN